MSIFRLLPFSLVMAAGVATLTAQSAPEKAPATIQSLDSGQLNTATDIDLLSPYPSLESNRPNAVDRILNGDYRLQLNQFSVPRKFIIDMDSQPQADNVCLKMRVYKVARDGPNTDSMHPVGYTTCSPAARFVTHTIDGVIRPTTP